MTTLREGLASGTWVLDVGATTAQFSARDVLRKTVVGTLPVLSGSVQVSAEGAPVQVRADLDLTGVATGNARRDRDLRGPRFFDVERGVVLRVLAGPARTDAEGRWLLPGELLLHDVRCPLDVAVELVGTEDGRVRVRATATLDRRDLGITVPRLLVGHDVAVVVEAVLVAPTAA